MISNDFVSRMLEWSKKKDTYIDSKLSTDKGQLAPRKNIMLRIPLEFEEEIKAFAKRKRKESDANYTGSLERHKMELAIEFEKNNPPPRAD